MSAPPTNRYSAPRASVYKNAGLAYLNLVRSPRQTSPENEGGDVLVTPQDPLGAASLLPWKTETFVAENGHHQANKNRPSSLNADGDGDHCPALYGGKGGDSEGEGRGRGRKPGATSPLRAEASVGTETSGGGTLAKSNNHGSGCSSSSSKAIGSWRNDASTRFMHMWKQFLDHEDAPLDSQYDTVRDIYGNLIGRFGTSP